MRRFGALLLFSEGDLAVNGWVKAFQYELQRLGWKQGGNIQGISFGRHRCKSVANRGGRVSKIECRGAFYCRYRSIDAADSGDALNTDCLVQVSDETWACRKSS